jgi:hypothetical protein
VFKSLTNSPPTWSDSNDANLTNTANVQALAIDPSFPNTVYAGTNTDGVFRSIDGGASWLQRVTGLSNSDVQALAIDPDVTTTLYAGTNGGGVFKSENRGDSWTAVNTGLTNFNVQTFAIDSVDTDIIYAGTDFGSLFISMDGGDNWSAISGDISGANVLSLAVDPDTTTTLYAGTAGEGLFKLTERGEPSGGSGGGASCFIATAAYGSSIEWQVKLLGEFRDRFLLISSVGKGFVNFYYIYSPPIAKFVAKHESARFIVRLSLLPAVGFSWMALNFGPGATLTLVFLLIAVASVATVVLAKRVRLR